MSVSWRCYWFEVNLIIFSVSGKLGVERSKRLALVGWLAQIVT